MNKAAMTEEGLPAMPHSGLTSLTYSSLFPNTSVMINWHNQQCDLSQVRKQWLVSNEESCLRFIFSKVPRSGQTRISH